MTTPPLGCAQRINSAPQRYVVDTAIHDSPAGPPAARRRRRRRSSTITPR